MIHVIAEVELVEGQQANFLAEFHKLMPLVHAEQGCIEYGPTRDLATGIPVQIPLRNDVITIIEKWESLEALKAHLIAEHMHAYRARVKDFVRAVSLRVTEPA